MNLNPLKTIEKIDNKISKFKSDHKKTYYTCLIGLWCIAPIEMFIITMIKEGIKRN